MIPIARPCLGPEEERAVAEVMASGMLAAGPKVRAFEAAFARFCGLPGDAAVACSSGTSGLSVAVQSLGLPRGTKVLTTPFSFIATANCILAWGLQPVFIDVDPETAMITAAGVEAALAADPAIRAVVPVHLYGQPCEIHDMVEVAHARGALVIEDCAQAHGATENGQPVGSVGDLAVFSFYATKNMTTGEGGMVTTNDRDLADRLRLLRNHGIESPGHHTLVGYNWRLTEMQAAIGTEQLTKLPGILDRKRDHARRLTELLEPLAGVTSPTVRPECGHVFMLYTLLVDGGRDQLLVALHDQQIEARVYFPPAHRQPIFAPYGADLPVTDEVAPRMISVPIHARLAPSDIDTIAATIAAARRGDPGI